MRDRTVSKIEASRIANETSDAYSYDRYGERAWRASCEMLARYGCTAKEIEAVMRSKYMRWAADCSNHEYGHCTSLDLKRYLDKYGWKEKIGELMEEL